MKGTITQKIVSILLALVLFLGMIPFYAMTVYAGHTCPDCLDWIDGSPYCSECYKCEECIELCLQCGKCTDCTGAEICDGCSDEESGNMCTDCSEEKGTHCPECGTCYFIAQSWCVECGACESCTDICDSCSVNLGLGLLCWDCAEGKESHCPGCGGCYFEEGLWCEDCMLCVNCSEHDEGCSVQFGQILCKECASDRGSHCPDCSQCYYDVGSWCEECGKCEDCSPACLYCCEEAGAVICEDCAIESGMHCTECSGCYDGGEYCIECGVCTACADICATDELCLDCAIANGYHCPGCEVCCDQAILCDGCGERCSECADAFCESCNLCSECVLICQDCGSCAECAVICPNCEEYCSECEGICDDCEFCLVCCADIAGFAGCDCTEWVCVESGDWNEHFDNTHNEAVGSHSVRPVATWQFDNTYHWHDCAYCDDAGHRTGKSKHTYDATGKCTTCYYVKDAKIQIIVQPKNVKYVCVTSAEEDYDESNIAHFSVKAIGNSALTYTWCRKQYVQGILTYVPLKNPGEGECYDGPNLAILAPTDACCNEYIYACIITDEDGNEVKTVDVLLTGRHDYQYYKQWRTQQRPYEGAERNKYGHILQCVGETCGKVTHLLPHEDEDRNGYCDVCNFEIGKILITKQPKDVKDVYVSSALEDYSDYNYAHFHVEAEGESKLTYTWCRKQYVQGVLTYVPLRYPDANECFDGPDASIWVPTDACCSEYTYACIITDEEGNETRTVDVVISARHNYQYYKQYLTHENPYPDALRKYHGHILVCVGEGCGKESRLRPHEDENHDYKCDLCDSQKDFTEIGLTVTAPKEGALPNYTVTTDSVAYYAMGGSSNYTQYRFWFVSDNGTSNWKLMDKTTAFVAGKYYKFVVEMQVKTGYTFPTYNSEPSFWAKVNGDYVMPQKTYGMDPTRYATVEYNFGECNDSVIENIIIENVTTPVAGEKPTYSATVRGSGYYIDTNKNSYYDAYWANEKWYYIKNGIGWFDMTEYDWVYENETFIPGHEYQVRVFLKTEDGYTFYHSNSYDMLFTASVNGFSATGNTTNSWGLTEQTISASFLCEGKKITTVMVNGLSLPQADETPDYTASVAYPEWYQLDPNYGGTGGIIWFDSEGNQMEPTDTFVEGQKYRVELKLIPTKLSGSNTSQFVTPVAAYVNGKQVTASGDWDNVYGNSTAVYIYYSFPTGALAPAAQATVSGQITSFGYEGSDVTVQLIPEGMPEPAYETIVTGNAANYNFANVPKGTYTLRVTKVYHKDYTETVTVDKNTVRNVTLVKNGPVFSDVSTSSWQHPFATYACERGLMAGKGTDGQGRIKFDPNKPISREEFVQVLYNAEGKPSVSSSKVFPDVASNGWYKNAVLWAYEMGIASGMGNGNFGIGKNITRQDLAMMLYKYAQLKNCSMAANVGVINQYADGNKVAGYARTAMDWAVTNGILSGKGETGKPLSTFRLDPAGTATRAECAAMLKNFMDAFGL